MRLQITSGGEDHSVALDEHIEQGVHERCGPFTGWFTSVHVHLSQASGRERRHEQRCIIEARPAGMRPIAVSGKGSSAYEAFDIAATRLRRAVDRRRARRAA